VFLQFECGFDIELRAVWCNKELHHYEVYHPNTLRVRIEDSSFYEFLGRKQGARIELKPQMGDDFPSVLRQMKRNGADTLVIGEFNSVGCTLEQVRAIFGDKRIVTLQEIQKHRPSS
jgi:hypothetical protein